MAFRIHLLFVCTALALLSLHHANAFPLTNSTTAPRIVGFSWQNCGAAADPLIFKSVTLTPDPLQIPGSVTLGISFTLSIPSPTDVALMVIMQKKIASFYIKVPCVNNFGSCNYLDVCGWWANVCVKYLQPFGYPCHCPIPANTYTVPDTEVEVTKPLPSGATGDFRIYANFLSGSAGELGCLEVEFNLA